MGTTLESKGILISVIVASMTANSNKFVKQTRSGFLLCPLSDVIANRLSLNLLTWDN